MYTFIKILHNGKEKRCAKFNSTLDAEYHAYINWCEENSMGWKLVETSTGIVKFKNK
jgi:hypothetical protein